MKHRIWLRVNGSPVKVTVQDGGEPVSFTEVDEDPHTGDAWARRWTISAGSIGLDIETLDRITCPVDGTCERTELFTIPRGFMRTHYMDGVPFPTFVGSCAWSQVVPDWALGWEEEL
tara:strand:+ start:75 stop:425 length:351 start_codon:yes stop_codon:yes gene_type:complete